NINQAKEKFESDEKMLASAFKFEKFYKKYKFLVLGTVGAIILFFGGKAIIGVVEESRLASANEAYMILLKDSKDSTAMATLKEKNPILFELFQYKNAMENNNTEVLKTLSSSKNELIADIAGYHLAIMNGTEANSKIYAEVALVNNAHLLIKEGKISEANDELSSIEEKSPLHNISKIMKHYVIKGQ
ncbi:MAG: hypothetical protein KAG56_10410, partial [Sulfurovaceae bacterium]|nr:hypothetical protein [Sulfurovaceae bacterium]